MPVTEQDARQAVETLFDTRREFNRFSLVDLDLEYEGDKEYQFEFTADYQPTGQTPSIQDNYSIAGPFRRLRVRAGPNEFDPTTGTVTGVVACEW